MIWMKLHCLINQLAVKFETSNKMSENASSPFTQ